MCKRNVTLNRHMTEPAGELTLISCQVAEHCFNSQLGIVTFQAEGPDVRRKTQVIVARDLEGRETKIENKQSELRSKNIKIESMAEGNN